MRRHNPVNINSSIKKARTDNNHFFQVPETKHPEGNGSQDHLKRALQENSVEPQNGAKKTKTKPQPHYGILVQSDEVMAQLAATMTRCVLTDGDEADVDEWSDEAGDSFNP